MGDLGLLRVGVEDPVEVVSFVHAVVFYLDACLRNLCAAECVVSGLGCQHPRCWQVPP
jgi:hypothetical protein